MQRTSPASYNSVDRAVEGETRAGLSSALRPTRLLAFRRYTWHEHALWGHAPIFLSRASNARCGESPHAPSTGIGLIGDGVTVPFEWEMTRR